LVDEEAVIQLPLSGLELATFLLLACTIGVLWIARWAWLMGVILTIAVGYLSGVLIGLAALWIAALAAACQFYATSRTQPAAWKNRAMRAVAVLAIGVLSIGLAVHLIPGFHNRRIVSSVILSAGAAPYDLWLNFDKTVAGLLVLALCYRGLIRTRAELTTALKRAAIPIALTIIILLSLSLGVGYVRWAPKLTSLFWLWAAVNLLSTCMSEEAFFRGFIQTELSEGLRHLRYGRAGAVVVSATLFGMAHIAGGLTYVGLATAAGLGYGMIFQRTQRIEMSILAHFSLNATHFLFFTYPYA